MGVGVFLAPMAGITDLPFRLVAKEFGADLVTTEMISAQALTYANHRTLRMITLDAAERPAAVQLFGSSSKTMARAAQIVCEHVRPEMIDLNFGCPTPKVVKNGSGSALLKNPELLGSIAEAVAQAVPIPVTAKIRLGWDQGNINVLEVAKRLEAAGMHWITVHARTRDQFYSGQANWEWIEKVKKTVSISVVGNGDVFSARDAQALLEQTGCDHIAIGRGARGNPWIFRQIKAWLTERSVLPEPTTAERAALALRHLRLKAGHAGEARAVKEMRPHLMWYLKGIRGSAQVRSLINSAVRLEELENLLKQFL